MREPGNSGIMRKRRTCLPHDKYCDVGVVGVVGVENDGGERAVAVWLDGGLG